MRFFVVLMVIFLFSFNLFAEFIITKAELPHATASEETILGSGEEEGLDIIITYRRTRVNDAEMPIIEFERNTAGCYLIKVFHWHDCMWDPMKTRIYTYRIGTTIEADTGSCIINFIDPSYGNLLISFNYAYSVY